VRVGEASGEADDYRDYIVARIRAASPARIPAVLLCETKQGYQGGETRVKQFVRTLVPAHVPEPIVQLKRIQARRAGGLRDGGPRSGASVGVHCDARLKSHGLCRVLR
jgi:hypothetical protein